MHNIVDCCDAGGQGGAGDVDIRNNDQRCGGGGAERRRNGRHLAVPTGNRDEIVNPIGGNGECTFICDGGRLAKGIHGGVACYQEADYSIRAAWNQITAD